MPRQVPSETTQELLKIIERFPSGASVEDVSKNLTRPLPRRTIQRYLAFLMQNGSIISTGETRAKKYWLVEKAKTEKDSIPLKEGGFSTEAHTLQKRISPPIPLTAAALAVKMSVRQPIQARKPVGYNRDFLNKYRPNETYYLPETVRKHLFEIGKPPNTERPAGTYARQIFNRLLIDLSWNSSRLEGNTYSLLETERLIELGEASEEKDALEAQMILNHKAAIEFMVESADQMSFNSFNILNLHALLSDNLLRDQRNCGALRSYPVSIGKSVYQPLAVPQLIEEYFEQILNTADLIVDPFEQSFFAMVHLPYLQPFIDVNKRVSRIAANIPFIRENLCPLSFVDVPEDDYVSGLLGVYELNKIELLLEVYVWAYERSSSLYLATRQEFGEPDLFRLRYRSLIIETIGEIIRKKMNKQTAIKEIRQKAITTLEQNDREKFVEVVETELMSLHKGNIAKFKVRPSEFDSWLEKW